MLPHHVLRGVIEKSWEPGGPIFDLERLATIGNPKGLEGTFSTGIISGLRTFDNGSLLQITAPISPGSSGGPVVDSEGKVIGVAVATYRGGQNLNFAVPATEVKKLIDLGVENVKPLVAKRTKAGKSILEELGAEKLTRGVEGTAFSWDGTGNFSFTFHNKLREAVEDVQALVIFYDNGFNPVDFTVVQYRNVIPAGLSKRVSGQVELSTVIAVNAYVGRSGTVDIRILGFQIAGATEYNP